jgi:Flp pilus assembly protein TadD
VACGCAEYGARPASPAQGGRAWVEASSPRFRVVSDLPAAEAEAIARELEQGLEAIDLVAFEHARTRLEPTTVVVFNSASDFHAFMPNAVEGRFYRSLPGDLEPSSIVVIYGALDESSRITCLHELTHDLFDRNFGPAPPWLSEGWAQYFSTIQIEPDRIKVGAALPHLTFTQDDLPIMARAEDGSHVLAMPVKQVAPPSELLGMDRRTFYASAFSQQAGDEERRRGRSLYLGAWALVHLLHDGPDPYPQRFKRFLEAARNSALPAAWQSAFAGLSAADFDHDFRVYLAKREMATFEYKRPTAAATVSVAKRALSDAEVRVYWARLSSGGASEAAALLDLDAAVAGSPASAEPRYFRGSYWLHRRQLPAAERDLVEAARLAPSDPRYLFGVLMLRIEQSKAEERVHLGDPIMQAAEPLALVARSATQLRVLALLYDHLGQFDRALELVQRAVAVAPIDSLCLDAEAQILTHLGRLHEALGVQRAAVAFLPENAAAPEIVKHLSLLEAAAL